MTPWGKWRADFASTRVQLTYAVAFVWCLVMLGAFLTVYKAMGLMTKTTDALAVLQGIAAVLGAASAAFIATVGAWFAGKWLAQNTNNK